MKPREDGTEAGPPELGGAYRGLDKWDTVPGRGPNAAVYWYSRVVMGPPDVGALPFPPACPATFAEWSPASATTVAPTPNTRRDAPGDDDDAALNRGLWALVGVIAILAIVIVALMVALCRRDSLGSSSSRGGGLQNDRSYAPAP